MMKMVSPMDTKKNADTEESAEVQSGNRILDQEDYIAEITKLEYSQEKKCYVATVKSFTDRNHGYYSKNYGKQSGIQCIILHDCSTADLTIYSDPGEITQEIYTTSDPVTLYAVPLLLR
ncbi:MAG: hypothetical protein ACLS61_11210 [Ruminococcus sp.]